jgi:hypothetical protein
MAIGLVQVKCPHCRATEVFVATKVGTKVPCWSDHTARFKLPAGRPFGAPDWVGSGTPGPLRACLEGLQIAPPPRANLGFAAALIRTVYPKHRSVWLRKAVGFAEAFLATGTVPRDEMAEILDGLMAGEPPWARPAWAQAGVCCISGYPLGWPMCIALDMRFPRLVADLIREFVPNPFLPLTWNTDWFTPTVRALAAHIYEAREFSALPILADALQEAGCADEQILAHCRSTNPHARGCWVLDAVLGRA